MFSVTIVFGPTPMPLTLLYRNQLDARRIVDLFGDCMTSGAPLHVEDDFGNVGSIAWPIHACLCVDLDANIEADVERALVQARTQAKANIAGRNDPVIRAAAMAGQIAQGNGRMPFGQ